MKAREMFLVGLTMLLPILLLADDRSLWNSAAVDARGVRHRGSNYPNGGPWMEDAIKSPPPDYPSTERSQGHTGSGLFRLTLDLKTGSITKVTTLQSTGFPTLDSFATEAFRRWRWKPGKWKEIDVPITFTLRSNSLR
jgi:TonB family protein